jgi:penicillin amidase
LLLVFSALWVRRQILGSLPQLDGERAVAGLETAVRIERDNLGTPTIRGANRLDVARALGFVHGQDRFFHMDLLRRSAAGELSELFGRATIGRDRSIRVHRFRSVARSVQQLAPAEDQALAEAYAAGVNAGLTSLGSKPFEYLFLRVDPVPWRAEDSILVLLAMFIQLHDASGRRESSNGVMHDLLPPKIVQFLLPAGTEWDAPLMGDPAVQPPIPGPDVFDLRTTSLPAPTSLLRLGAADREEPLEAPGSNNWAVAGAHSLNGRALIANDMHLGLSIPNTWYRATLIWPARSGGENWISGVTLPGTPVVSVGSNRSVAWGFTNSHGDWNDLVIVETDPADSTRYLAPSGSRPFERHRERIAVKGSQDESLEVVSTLWGPLIDKDHQGRPRALRWTAHDPEAVNSSLRLLEEAKTLEEALAIAQRSGIPSQNFVCADSTGRIGWTLTGKIPRRIGFDGQVPTSWADGTRRWEGWLRPEEYPRIVDPPSGRLWTANARVLSGKALAQVGDGGYVNGHRARQIRDALMEVEKATPEAMLRIQLDDRALFLARWRQVMLDALTEQASADRPKRRELKAHVENWGGHASVDSVGYRAVRTFHDILERQVFGALTARCWAADPHFDFFDAARQREGPLWTLVTERPVHLLSPKFRGWDEQILAAIDATLISLTSEGSDLAKRTWGERNRSRIQHPFSRAMPALGRVLDMASEPLPGDVNMPRVQAPDRGASERLVVSPGAEDTGLFHMPGGQSGHPLSPYYRAGHDAWAHGEATPFHSNIVAHRLTLVPAPPP